MKTYNALLLAIVLGGCVGSPVRTANQTVEEVASDISGYTTERLCDGLDYVSSGQCRTEFELSSIAYDGYCDKSQEARLIVLNRRGAVCPNVDIARLTAIMSGGDPIIHAISQVENTGSNHWSNEIIAMLNDFEQFGKADDLEWAQLRTEPQGRYETEEEYLTRIESGVDKTETLVYTRVEAESTIPSSESMRDYVLFSFDPFASYDIDTEIERSSYQASNAFGATTTVYIELGKVVRLSPVSRWMELEWRDTAMPRIPLWTHNSLPLSRSRLIENNSSIEIVSIYAVEKNNPLTYTTQYEDVEPTLDRPFGRSVEIQRIQADLQYAGLYDRQNNKLVGVFSQDLHLLFLVEESLEIDLTRISARVPLEWRN